MSDDQNDKAANRDSIRSKILGGNKAKSEVVQFMGEEIEIRQPPLGLIFSFQEKEIGFLDFLINCTYVPGTNEKVFEEADRDGLKELPVGDDVMNLVNTFNRLTGMDVEAARKNSETTHSGSTS